jgi:hypothetical protein
MRTRIFAIVILGHLSAGTLGAQQWLNLTVLMNYPNPTGSTCSTSGNPNASPEKKASNRLKNRFRLPTEAVVATIPQILALPPGAGGTSVPPDGPMQRLAVIVVGYVGDVRRGGTSGESCNCGATGSGQVDTHIELVLTPEDGTDQAGRRMLVVEVTERSRRLAKLGLLPTNIGNNWSNNMLRSRLLGRWVRFTGWLFYDDDHHLESWAVDPDDTIERSNWRGTAWELHPVMGIEVLPGKPADLPPAPL